MNTEAITQFPYYIQTMPNLRSLDCSYTAVCYAAFTGCGPQLASLESLDMSGCSFVTDQCVQCLVARIPDTAGAGFILISSSPYHRIPTEYHNDLVS